ncbi:hypothetical protein DFH09DRAFT_1084954 [Mycena vulgaris]|nr:hypothetical protein DFH09DRAFT_1084954 [Mycena vulgaris]
MSCAPVSATRGCAVSVSSRACGWRTSSSRLGQPRKRRLLFRSDLNTVREDGGVGMQRNLVPARAQLLRSLVFHGENREDDSPFRERELGLAAEVGGGEDGCSVPVRRGRPLLMRVPVIRKRLRREGAATTKEASAFPKRHRYVGRDGGVGLLSRTGTASEECKNTTKNAVRAGAAALALASPGVHVSGEKKIGLGNGCLHHGPTRCQRRAHDATHRDGGRLPPVPPPRPACAPTIVTVTNCSRDGTHGITEAIFSQVQVLVDGSSAVGHGAGAALHDRDPGAPAENRERVVDEGVGCGHCTLYRLEAPRAPARREDMWARKSGAGGNLGELSTQWRSYNILDAPDTQDRPNNPAHVRPCFLRAVGSPFALAETPKASFAK